MQSFLSLILAIEYIEANLTNPISLEDIASEAYISLSHLHRMFSRVFGCPLREYMTKRRLCSAAHELVHSDITITDLAFKYQYGSVESFSRAFRKQFLVSPSAFRQANRFTELYPRIILKHPRKGDGKMTPIPKYDLTELSQRIVAAKGTYILDVDIDNLMRINEELGRGAGDVAIAETAARIERSVSPGTAFFRISADEFIVITEREDLASAEAIAQKILSHSDDPVTWNDTTFTFSVSVGIAKIPTDIKESTPAVELVQEAMYQAKQTDRNTYKVI